MLNKALAFVLTLGMFWDFVTAYAGTLLLLSNLNWLSLGTSLIGSAIVCVLNFYTTRVWRNYEDDGDKKSESFFITWIVRGFWLGAIILNFYTSFVSISFYGLEEGDKAPGPGASLVVIFITALIVISPMTLGKVWEERKKREIAEQKLKQYQN
ncbi:MAG: hypothetical protein SVX43_11405 [Cyanobacteriota bacterium]|nr:hypothetical protein [Cyanobacteriota bacterium]